MPPVFTTADHYGALKEALAHSKDMTIEVAGTVGEDLGWCIKSIGRLSDRVYCDWKSAWHKGSRASVQQMKTKVVCSNMIEALQKTIDLIDLKSGHKMINHFPKGAKPMKPFLIRSPICSPIPSPPTPPLDPSQSVVVSTEKRSDGAIAVAPAQPTVYRQSASGALVVAEKKTVQFNNNSDLQTRYDEVVKRNHGMVDRLRTVQTIVDLSSKQCAELVRCRQELQEKLETMTVERSLMVANAQDAVKLIIDISAEPSIALHMPAPIRDRVKRVLISELLKQSANAMAAKDNTIVPNGAAGSSASLIAQSASLTQNMLASSSKISPKVVLSMVESKKAKSIDNRPAGINAPSIIPIVPRQLVLNPVASSTAREAPNIAPNIGVGGVAYSTSSIFPSLERHLAHQLAASITTHGFPNVVLSGGGVRNVSNLTQRSVVAPPTLISTRLLSSVQQPQSNSVQRVISIIPQTQSITAGGAVRNGPNQGTPLQQQWPKLQFAPAVESRRFICFVCGIVVADPASTLADPATMHANFAKMNRQQLAQLQVATAMGDRGVAVVCKTHSLGDWLQHLQQLRLARKEHDAAMSQLQHLTCRKRTYEDVSGAGQRPVMRANGGQWSISVQDEGSGQKDEENKEEIIEEKKVRMEEE